jgi:predicted branched-subunit amino acid permease
VIDESTAMATAQADEDDQATAFWATGLAIFVCWNGGTLLGALGGSVIGDPNALGLDAAFPAGFVVLIAPHLRRVEGRLAAALGAAIALVLVPIAPTGLPIIAASAAALVGLRRR